MNGQNLRPGYRIEMDLDVSLTVLASVPMWNGDIAVLFHEIPVTVYFPASTDFDVVDLDWHMSPLTHSYA